MEELPSNIAGSTDLIAGAISPATRSVASTSQLTSTIVPLDVHHVQEEGSSENKKNSKRKNCNQENVSDSKKRKSYNQENVSKSKKIKPNNNQNELNKITVETSIIRKKKHTGKKYIINLFDTNPSYSQAGRVHW